MIMNTKSRSSIKSPITIAMLLGLAVLPTLAKDPKEVQPATPAVATDKDLAGDVSRYFGQRASLYRDNNRKLAKIDLDGDFNYDGTIDNDDPADNGGFQQTPPGLVVGKGELSKLIIRLTPYKIDYQGRAKVKLQVDGINRADKSGEFASGAESMGHIIVWRDAGCTEKLIDSRDPSKRSFEWTLEQRSPANLQIVPRTLYVQGVSVSPNYSGDIRLLLSVYDDNVATANSPNINPAKWVDTFRPSFDHLLFTVRGNPQPKNYINNNIEGVWLTAKGASK
jgi:hypothetical protein